MPRHSPMPVVPLPQTTSLGATGTSLFGFCRTEIEQSIAGRFEKVVVCQPSHVAVKLNDEVINYSTLNAMANGIAHALLSVSGPGPEPVGLLIQNDLRSIAAILGIAKAGKICVPLDRSFSLPWARFILRDTAAKFVLAGADGLELAGSWLETAHSLIEIESLEDYRTDTNPQERALPDDFSQILYTSGTTGQPKGVVDTHRNMLHYVMRLGNASHVTPDDRITLVRPPSSAGALSNLYLALLQGATIFPVDLNQLGWHAIADWLRREKITIFHTSGTVFRHFAEQLSDAERFPDLRMIRLGSGQLFERDLRLFKAHFPDTLLLHVLSSTETNTYRVHFFNKDSHVPEGALPVGYAVEDMEVLILNDSGNPVAMNEVGEISVRSDYIFPGYWNDSALTDAVFICDPERPSRTIYRTGDLGRLRRDGCLEYFGRKDFRLKIRGYRIQAEEVELALLQMPGIKQVAVTAHKNHYGDDRLTAYIAPALKEAPNVRRVRDFLAERLPEYMIPTHFVVLDRLPLNTNGKINRQALPRPDLDRSEHGNSDAPRTAIESVVAKIWCGCLGINSVGVHDRFLDLGGDSIIAARIVWTLGRVFGRNLTIAEFYDACTIAKIAQRLVERAPSPKRAETAATLFLKVHAMSAAQIETMLVHERNRRLLEMQSPKE